MLYMKRLYPTAEVPDSISQALCIQHSHFLPSSQSVAAVLKTKCLIHYDQINPAGVIPAGVGGSEKR